MRTVTGKRRLGQFLRRGIGKEEVSPRGVGTGGRTRSRFWRRLMSDKTGMLGCVMVCLIIGIALFAPWIAPYDPLAVDSAARLQPPSRAHLLGTDDLGRDVLSRVMWGARLSLRLAVIVVIFAVGLGVAIGVISGYLGGWFDQLVMRITDIFLAFPDLILAMAFAATLGPSIDNAALALGLVWWPSYARLMRGQVLAVKHRDFVEAVRALGANPRRVLLRHILPNGLDPILVRVTMTAGYAILAGASLSFVGLGAQPPSPEWGLMVAVGRNYFLTAWWFPTIVGLCVLMAVLAFTLAGDAIQNALGIRMQDT